MTKWIKIALSLCMFSMLFACGMLKDTMEETPNKVEENSNTSTNEDAKLSDLMEYLKENKITLEDEKELNDFNFAAKEGMSFTYDGNKVYVYSVDMANAAIRTLMNQAMKENQVVANKDGKDITYGASANDNYLMIYELEAKVDDLLESFEKYKKENSANKN